MAGPPTPLAWKTTGWWPPASSAGSIRITAGVVWPSIVIPTQRSPRSSAGRPASRAMPTTAAAALSNTAREIGLRPRMSVTECITSVSPSPTKGPNGRRPEALGDTISFGTPTGSAAIAAAPSSAPSAPPRQSAPSTRRSAQSRSSDRAHALLHLLHRRPARARRAHVVELAARGPGNLGARHVCLAADALAEDARVDHDRLTAERADPVAHVRGLLALGVERGYQRDSRGVAQTALP